MIRTHAAARKTARRPSTYRPRLERLEDRLALAAIAAAGLDQDVNRGSSVALNGLASTGSGQLTYTWTQKSGPDVTLGVGTLSGASPQFTAPARISTLEFELVVADSSGSSAPDYVVISTLEDHSFAVFVSSTGSDSSAGTRATPMQHIQAAIVKAAITGGDVYVAAGTFPESLSLFSGVSVYGGFDGNSWLRDPASNNTVIAGGATAVQGLNAQNLVLDGLTIKSANATAAGASSIGVYLSAATNIELSGNSIQAGNGANGDPGADGLPPATATAPTGNDGADGCSQCTTSPAGGSQTGGVEFGGKGGSGGNDSNSGQNGSVGSGNAPVGQGGSSSDCFESGDAGSNGGNGPSGAAGSSGGPGAALGTISSGQYVPSSGGDGQKGTNGKGGSGGGGGGGGDNAGGFCFSDGGGGGGSGGPGGLGGNQGLGGKGGGGSFSILLVSSSVSIHDNAITTANGGAGGDGGDGGAGQIGGQGGQGGDGSDDAGPGGKGGKGGNGGPGGAGGGGGGGPSIGIFSSGAATGTSANNTLSIGAGGNGGSGGTHPLGGTAPVGATGSVSESVGGISSGAARSEISLDTNTVAENLQPNSPVGRLGTITALAVDPTFTYELVPGLGDDNNSSFAIDGSQLVTAHELDFDGRSSLSVRVRCTDAGNVSVEKVFNISVMDVNELPTCTIRSFPNTTDESGPHSVPAWIKNCSPGAPSESGQQLSITITAAPREFFSVLPAIDASGTLTFVTAPNVRGSGLVEVTIRDDGGTANGGLDGNAVDLFFHVTKPHPWHNAANSLDVTGPNGILDNEVVAADALAIINYINAFTPGAVPANAAIGAPYGFLDTGGGENGTGDNSIAPSDALNIINAINAGDEGEGEYSSATPHSALRTPHLSAFGRGPPDPDPSALIALLAADLPKPRRPRAGDDLFPRPVPPA